MLRPDTMQIEAIRRPFTVDEYNLMIETGILGKADRVELIEGEILELSPIGNRHQACVDRATALFVVALTGKAIVRTQGAIELGDYSKPQPDLILLEPRKDYYASKGAVTRNAFLVIEVSDTSIRYDRGPKLKVYARHGASEVWIEDLTTDTLLVFEKLQVRFTKLSGSSSPGTRFPRSRFQRSPSRFPCSWKPNSLPGD